MRRITFFVMVNEVLDFLTGRSVNFEVFRHPGNYMLWLPLSKIIADSKVSRQGIEQYKQMILRNEDTGPIILLKDPVKDLYVVLDGHHRYYAYQELGKEKISCAVVGDYSDVLFYLALNGKFQPHGLITDLLRHPLMRVSKSLKRLFQRENSPIAFL